MVEGKPTRRAMYQALLLAVTTILALAALLSPLLARFTTPSLAEGQVADQDYRAPGAFSFTSAVLTDQRREQAVRSTSPVYTPLDTSVARRQLDYLRAALAYITSVREDPFASSKQKLDDLAALENISLRQETANTILSMSAARWQSVQQEAIVVLEQVMRSPIRTDRLEEARAGLPSLVSLSLPEQQAEVVAELAAAFVAPNSVLSERLTEAARQQARLEVTPVTRSYIPGQLVVQRGQVLSAADVEAMREMGLDQPRPTWQEPTSAAILALLMAAFLVFYLRRGSVTLVRELRGPVVMAALFLVFLFGARLSLPGHTILPYAYPLAAYSLTVAALFGIELAMVSSLPLAILAAHGLPNAMDLTLYYTFGSLFGVLALGSARRLSSFMWAGLGVTLAGICIVLIYRLPQPSTDWIGLVSLAGAALFNGMVSAGMTVLLQSFMAQFLGMTTPMQLMDLIRPDHPLLQLMLREAPGTYQHSLQVANLAEQAAERIGADPLLTRVGALYHDIGKVINPVFFIENQVPGFPNPHDDLDPVSSAAIIVRHVSDGLALGRKHRLPRRLADFIAEHHGSMLTSYQYAKAVTLAHGDKEQVPERPFLYPGPRPQSRETAILMLADGSEARVRAEKPMDEEELRRLIKGVIDHRVATGELDDTTLTLKDLSTILDSFTTTLRGIYHPRVKYPAFERLAASDEPVTQRAPGRGNAEEPAPTAERPAPLSEGTT